MTTDPADDDRVDRDEFDPPTEDDVAAELDRLEQELYDVRGELSRFEAAVEERTVDRPGVKTDLRRYVRARMRRGHARGWGPYLVLLYGTAMTIGGFHFLEGGWAILAMVVIWLSTLGLYVFMLVIGLVFRVAGLPGRLRDLIGSWRSR